MASKCPNIQGAGGICRVVKKEAENLATGVTRGACDCNFICHAHHGSKLCKTPQTIHGNSLGILMWGNTNAPRKSTCAKKTALLLTQGSRNAVFLSARRNYLSTCLSTHLRTQTLACQFGSSKAVRVYLFIGKRAVRGAEEHLKRQR